MRLQHALGGIDLGRFFTELAANRALAKHLKCQVKELPKKKGKQKAAKQLRKPKHKYVYLRRGHYLAQVGDEYLGIHRTETVDG